MNDALKVLSWKTLQRLRKERAALHDEIVDLQPLIFNVGSRVGYRHGKHFVELEVIEEVGPWRCKVRNVRSGRTYMLDYDKITHLFS